MQTRFLHRVQEGIKCTKAKEYLRAYYPKKYNVHLGDPIFFREGHYYSPRKKVFESQVASM